MSEKNSNDRKAKDVDGGWAWVALFATFLAFVVQTGSMLSKGVYIPSYLEHFAKGRSNTALIGSSFVAFFHFGSLLSSLAVSQFGPRVVVMTGGVLMSFSYFILSFVESISSIIVVYGLLGGLGGIFVISGCIAILPSYFKRHIFIASGITFGGGGIGVMTVGSLTEYCIDLYGWRGALLIQSGLCLHICMCSALMYNTNPSNRKSTFKRPLVVRRLQVDAVIDNPPATEKLLDARGRNERNVHISATLRMEEPRDNWDKLIYDYANIKFIDDPDEDCDYTDQTHDQVESTNILKSLINSIDGRRLSHKLNDDRNISKLAKVLEIQLLNQCLENEHLTNGTKQNVEMCRENRDFKDHDGRTDHLHQQNGHYVNGSIADTVNREVILKSEEEINQLLNVDFGTLEHKGMVYTNSIKGQAAKNESFGYLPRLRAMMVSKRFWVLTLATQFASMAGFTSILFFKDMLRQKEIGSRLMVLFMGGGGVFGRVSAGIIANHVNRILFFSATMLVLGCDLLLLLVANQVWMALGIGFLVTTCQGTATVLHTLMALDVYGRSGMHLAWTWSMAIAGIGVLAAAPLAGLVADVLGNYTGTIIMFASWALSASMLAVILFLLQRKQEMKEKQSKI